MSDWIGSPNFTKGREGHEIHYIVLHHMAGTIEGADAVFQQHAGTPQATSAHYGVARDGRIHQWVSTDNTAYHAGDHRYNLESIGIEHEDLNSDNYTDILYETSALLVYQQATFYGIPLDREHIKKHSEVSDLPTACPGTLDIDRIINLAKTHMDQSQIDRLNYLEGLIPGLKSEGFFLTPDGTIHHLVAFHSLDQAHEFGYSGTATPVPDVLIGAEGSCSDLITKIRNLLK